MHRGAIDRFYTIIYHINITNNNNSMVKTYTKEQKAAYFQKLRDDWKLSKQMAENNENTKAMFRESGLEGVSLTSFHYVLQQMQAQKINGIPYVHAKTFNKWVEAGFKVKRGSKSTLEGITWVSAKGKEEKEKKNGEEDISYIFPKVYHLFHEGQVEAI